MPFCPCQPSSTATATNNLNRSKTMCRSRRSPDIIHSSTPTSRMSKNPHKSSVSSSSSSSFPADPAAATSSSSSSINFPSTNFFFSSSTVSSRTSLSNIRESLPESPHIYGFSEITRATGNFLSKPFSSSSSSTSWRCLIRGKDVILIQRKVRRLMDLSELQQRLSTICRSHHSSLVKLLGAATSGSYIYLAYDYINGAANLATCLRNPQNPNYTVLSTWLSRMQVATDIAHGLDYIHHCSGSDSGFVHNHVKGSSILVLEGSLNAKICHFGTAELCGESERLEPKTLSRSNSKTIKIEGTRGYMAPEFQVSGMATQKCDVYAFGIVVLELVSGQEALRYVLDDEGSGGYRRVSVIERAREAVGDGEGGSGVRRWADKRLRDSYPVEVAEKMVLLGLECVEEDPEKRPDMEQVAVRVSKLYLESKNWAERIKMPTDFSVSVAPR